MLKYVPFTSINLSELTNWTPTSGAQLVVTNADFANSVSQPDPVRGKVVPGSNPTQGNSNAYASIFSSNSGVALLPDPIDDEETTNTDSQVFNVAAVTTPSAGGAYTAIFSGYTFGGAGSYPVLTPSPTATCNPATTGGSKPNPYTCTVTAGNPIGTASVPVPVSLLVRSYNYEDTSRTSTDALTCTGPDGNVSYTPGNNDKYSVTYCKNYAISSVNLSGLIGSPSPSDGSVNESTTISFPNLINGDSIAIGMSYQGETKTANTCTYIKGTCSGRNCVPPNIYTVSSAPCQ